MKEIGRHLEDLGQPQGWHYWLSSGPSTIEHGANYRSKCQEVGMELRGVDDSDSEASDSEFTSEGLAERLAEWVAADDQVS